MCIVYKHNTDDQITMSYQKRVEFIQNLLKTVYEYTLLAKVLAIEYIMVVWMCFQDARKLFSLQVPHSLYRFDKFGPLSPLYWSI